MKKVLLFTIILVLAGTMVQAQTFQLDFVPDVTHTDLTEPVTIDAPDASYAAGTTFKVDVVLAGAEDMIGCNSDIQFASDVLEVISIVEKQGDVNFDSIANLSDFTILALAFNAAEGDDNYEAAYDFRGDGVIDLSEFTNAALGYLVDSRYWTDAQEVAGTAEEASRESVEIFDPIAVINANGVIDDIVAVLLRRPGDTRSFSGDAIVATVTFKVIGESGDSGNIQFIPGSTVILKTTDVDPSNPSSADAAAASVINVQ